MSWVMGSVTAWSEDAVYATKVGTGSREGWVKCGSAEWMFCWCAVPLVVGSICMGFQRAITLDFVACSTSGNQPEDGAEWGPRIKKTTTTSSNHKLKKNACRGTKPAALLLLLIVMSGLGCSEPREQGQACWLHWLLQPTLMCGCGGLGWAGLGCGINGSCPRGFTAAD